jgi:hypothetical protein
MTPILRKYFVLIFPKEYAVEKNGSGAADEHRKTHLFCCGALLFLQDVRWRWQHQ